MLLCHQFGEFSVVHFENEFQVWKNFKDVSPGVFSGAFLKGFEKEEDAKARAEQLQRETDSEKEAS